MIIGYVGPNGSGKTLLAVERHVVPALKAERRVLGNTPLAGGEMLREWGELAEVRDCVVLLDEITAVLPARAAMSLPPELARVLQQLRKRGVVVVWTAPAWARADVLLREVTQRVVACTSMLPKGRGAWAPRRLVRWREWDAGEYDATGGVPKKVEGRRYRPRTSGWVRVKSCAALDVYDTYGEVELLSHLGDSGACVVCGGTRRRPACSCAKPAPGKRRRARPAAASDKITPAAS